MSPEKLELLAFDMTGRYVFHGTAEDIDILEPQQAHNVKDGKRFDDGPPAIFATQALDYAIFMAVFSKKNCPLGRHTRIESWGFKDDTYWLKFQATKNTLSQIDDNSSGWVYVFNKSDFYLREPNGLEYTNRRPVAPLKKIRVRKGDLLGSVSVMA